MINEINKINPKGNCQESKTMPGTGNVQQKQDAVTLSTGSSKIKDLAETAKMLKFKKSLEKSIDKLMEVYKTTGMDEHVNDGSIYTTIAGPYNLKTASNSEIKKKMTADVCGYYDIDMAEGEKALSNFKSDARQILDIGDAHGKGYRVVDKIIDLFRNSGFSKIAYVCTSSNDEVCWDSNLMGITKDKQMIGINIGISYSN